MYCENFPVAMKCLGMLFVVDGVSFISLCTQTNRVLREFGAPNFIRVSLKDEDFEKLSSGEYIIENLLKRVALFLKNGFKLGDASSYSYVGASNSQIRDHACWFVRDDGTNVAARIRQWIGDLSGKVSTSPGCCAFSESEHSSFQGAR